MTILDHMRLAERYGEGYWRKWEDARQTAKIVRLMLESGAFR